MASTGSSSSGATPDTAAANVSLVAGLVSYQDAETIGPVVAAIRQGASRYLSGRPVQFVLADGGSTDATVTRAREALRGEGELVVLTIPRATADLLALPYHGVPGKARALQAVLTHARDVRADACVILDGSVRTAASEWVEKLAGPVLEGAVDFVSPHYRRQAFEGALTKGLVYPVVRTLYGVRLRQPAASEFACSGALLTHFLRDDVWEREGAQTGIDLWLATSAAVGEFRLGEAALGVRSHHTRGGEALDLATTIVQVVGALFADLERRAERWQRTRSSVEVRQFGSPSGTDPLPAGSLDAERLIESFRLGYRELRDIWTYVLPAKTIIDLRRLADAAPGRFALDDELWARIVYDFALGYRMRAMPHEHLLRSLVPLYSGWLASFALQIRDLDAEAADRRIDALAAVFEAQKAYLISRWRWPERLRVG